MATDYCKTDTVNTPLQGRQPAARDAILTLANTAVTSLVVDVLHGYTVAYLGSEQGIVKKVRM